MIDKDKFELAVENSYIASAIRAVMQSLWCTAEDRCIALCSKTCLRPARLLLGKTKTSLGFALLFSGVIVHGLSPLYPEAMKAFLETLKRRWVSATLMPSLPI